MILPNTSLHKSLSAGTPASGLQIARPLPSFLSASERNKPAESSGFLHQSFEVPIYHAQNRHRTTCHGIKNATVRFELPSPALAVRNLVEQAKIAHLCTTMSNMHHRRSGYPFGTLTEFASDGSGHPIFCLSPLAIHTRNIVEDCRVSLVVQLPGWSGLANARATIFGEVYQLPPDKQQKAKEIFLRKQVNANQKGWVMGNSMFFRMHSISDIYFVGGFGTIQWIDVNEYSQTRPDKVVVDDAHKTLQVMNGRFVEDLKKVFGRNNLPAEDAAFISIDKLGTDVRVRHGNDYSVQRLGFDEPVESLQDAISATSQRLLHGELDDVVVATSS